MSRQRSLPRTTTPSHRCGERGPGCRPANSQRGTSSYTWDEPSTASLQCGSCGDEKGGPNRPPEKVFHATTPSSTATASPSAAGARRGAPACQAAGVQTRFLHDCRRRRPQPAGPRRQAPRNVASILDPARELGIRDAQVGLATRAMSGRPASNQTSLGLFVAPYGLRIATPGAAVRHREADGGRASRGRSCRL